MPDIISQLQQLRESEEYPFHMPGHKRRYSAGGLGAAFGIDITEIVGYDNLYEAKGMLKKAMEYAAKVYGAEETFFLVNGSTVGILSAITGVTKYGDRILAARNCHKAVFHAMELRGLKAEYLHPEYQTDWDMPGVILSDEVARKLEEFPDTKAVILTSPTYEGLVSDVAAIAELVHAKNIPLIVDEAHGAHFVYDKRFPKSAIACGADIVIQSMHKTLPSFTQTALLHMKKGYADIARIKEYIGYYQTSSPSYLFMAGMDHCIRELSKEGENCWDSFFEMKEEFFNEIRELKGIRVFRESEPCKIVVSTKGTNLTGEELQRILLEKYQIQLEMAAENYVLLIATLCDTKEGFCRLADALKEIDAEVTLQNTTVPIITKTQDEDVVYTLAEVKDKEWESVLLEDAEGRICAEYVNLYPPGIPLFFPGERIQQSQIKTICRYLEKHLHVQGAENGRIRVCRENA